MFTASPESESITVTMGISTVIPSQKVSKEQFIESASLAKYHALQQGRNRTYVNGHYNTVNNEQSID